MLEEFNSFSCFSIGDYVKHSYDVGLVKINPDPHAKDSVISLSSIAERMALHPEPEIAQEIAENYDILLEEKDLKTIILEKINSVSSDKVNKPQEN